MKRSHLTIAALLAGIIVLAGCRQDAPPADATAPAAPGALETPPPLPAEPEVPAATVQVTDVQLGTEVDEDGVVTEPRTTFATDDRTIFAAVSAASDSDVMASAALGVRWTYQDGEDGQLVDERSEPLSVLDEEVIDFRISHPEAWVTGGYTLEVSVDGDVVESREFTVE